MKASGYLIFALFLILPAISSANNNSNLQSDTDSANVQHVIWNRVPIAFIVPTNAERMITFPSAVEVHNTNSDLTTDKVSILNNDGTLYIKAKKEFNPIRIPVVLKDSGQVILMDLSSKENADNSSVEVLFPSKQNDTNNNLGQGGKTAAINYTILTRYAVQHLYSPERLIEENFNINRTPMFTSKSVDLVYGVQITAMPLISWRGGDLYVTSVLLKNRLNKRVHLSPLQLKGQWLAATFYPTNYVTAKGDLHDRTTLILISDRPFNESLTKMREYK